MRITFILFFLGAILIVTSQPVQDAPADGHTDYELGGVEEAFVEETTTARPARRRLPGGRFKPKTEADAVTEPKDETPVVTMTAEVPTKRTRTSTSTRSGGDSTSRAATAKSTEEVTEQPISSTYRRPKFPPRRLPIPNKRTTTLAPVEDTLDPLYEDVQVADGPVGQDGHPAEHQVEEELVAEGAR